MVCRAVNLKSARNEHQSQSNYNHLISGLFNQIYSIVNVRLLPLSVHDCLVFPIFKMKVSSLNITKTKTKTSRTYRQGSYTLKQTLIIRGKSLKDILITAKFSGQKIQEHKRMAYQHLFKIDCILLYGLPGVSPCAL